VNRAEIERLATEVAAELSKIRTVGRETWTLGATMTEDDDDYPWAVIAGPLGARIKIIYGWYSPGRVTAVGLYPAGVTGKEIKANTNPLHPAARIARTVNNRVLGGGYINELVPAMAKYQRQEDNNARAAMLLSRAAELFSEAPADGERVYLGSRLRGSGTVKVHCDNWPGDGHPDGYTLNLDGIPEETALAMLAVLAARAEPRPACCKDYPGHPESLAHPGCAVYGDGPVPRTFDRTHTQLYSEYLFTGAWELMSFSEWLSQRNA
jgi:hypothetical protein